MNNGWIKLWRKFTEWEWYRDPDVSRLFLHLLLTANHEEKKWMGQTIQRGQLITGLYSLSEQTGLSVQTIRTCIDRLKSTGEITNTSTNKYRLITLIKYEDYQKDAREPTSKSTSKLTINQQTTNNQSTTNNKDKKDKNVKKEDTPAQSAGDSRMVIDLFRELNPSYQLLFRRKPQHEAARRLWDREGFEKLQNVVRFLVARRSDRYCPAIASPSQLEEKWASLEKYALGLKGGSQINNQPKWRVWT